MFKKLFKKKETKKVNTLEDLVAEYKQRLNSLIKFKASAMNDTMLITKAEWGIAHCKKLLEIHKNEIVLINKQIEELKTQPTSAEIEAKIDFWQNRIEYHEEQIAKKADIDFSINNRNDYALMYSGCVEAIYKLEAKAVNLKKAILELDDNFDFKSIHKDFNIETSFDTYMQPHIESEMKKARRFTTLFGMDDETGIICTDEGKIICPDTYNPSVSPAVSVAIRAFKEKYYSVYKQSCPPEFVEYMHNLMDGNLTPFPWSKTELNNPVMAKIIQEKAVYSIHNCQ